MTIDESGSLYMPVYNKLVRDRIPEIIEQSGKKCTTEILDDKEYVIALKKKLREELAEYEEAETNETAIEELADMLEIIHSLVRVHGTDMNQLEAVRKEKALKRGAFREKVFLIEVED